MSRVASDMPGSTILTFASAACNRVIIARAIEGTFMGTGDSAAIESLEPRTFLAAQLVEDLNTTTPREFDSLVALNGAIYASSGHATDTPTALWRRDESGDGYTLVHSAADRQEFQNVT